MHARLMVISTWIQSKHGMTQPVLEALCSAEGEEEKVLCTWNSAES